VQTSLPSRYSLDDTDMPSGGYLRPSNARRAIAHGAPRANARDGYTICASHANARATANYSKHARMRMRSILRSSAFRPYTCYPPMRVARPSVQAQSQHN
jgi:hypothetical protein